MYRNSENLFPYCATSPSGDNAEKKPSVSTVGGNYCRITSKSFSKPHPIPDQYYEFQT